MKLIFWRKQPKKPVRAFPVGPNWFCEPYRSFFTDEVLNHLLYCELDGGFPNSHQILDGIEVAVASTFGRVIVVSKDAYFLESLNYKLYGQPYDTVLSPPGTPGGVGVLLCTARGLKNLPPSDGAWAEFALKAFQAS